LRQHAERLDDEEVSISEQLQQGAICVCIASKMSWMHTPPGPLTPPGPFNTTRPSNTTRPFTANCSPVVAVCSPAACAGRHAAPQRPKGGRSARRATCRSLQPPNEPGKPEWQSRCKPG
jgi:hypothetical protein